MRKAAVLLSVAAIGLAGCQLDSSADRPGGTASEEQKEGSDPKTEVKRFSGSGTKNLGQIRVGRESLLEWRHNSLVPGGGFFILQDESTALNITSQGRRGDSVVDRGNYRRVQVTADGAWEFTIRPR